MIRARASGRQLLNPAHSGFPATSSDDCNKFLDFFVDKINNQTKDQQKILTLELTTSMKPLALLCCLNTNYHKISIMKGRLATLSKTLQQRDRTIASLKEEKEEVVQKLLSREAEIQQINATWAEKCRLLEETFKKDIEEEKSKLEEVVKTSEERVKLLEEDKKFVEEEKKQVEAEKDLLEEQKKQVEEQKNLSEDRKKQLEAEKHLSEDLKKQLEAEKHLSEDLKKQLEAEKHLADELKKKLEAKKNLAEKQKKEMEAKKNLAEKLRKQMEAEKKLVEEQKKKAEEQKSLAEEQKADLAAVVQTSIFHPPPSPPFFTSALHPTFILPPTSDQSKVTVTI
ncbi:hypothetical protein L3Q82_004681 [Scortum barcoo]|uniref:Uncharacterized protein n=1 Tax=Scortum barcoo TaxID=214431 RepID=A0ACB8VHZ9_9TELE|nr:hypothetical protein L3Q82_004681 [Scortum barcoo]